MFNLPSFFFFFFLTSLRSISQSVSSVAQSCLTLCDPMNHSTPGLPVHHQLLEFPQTHVHQVGDTIQPSHPPATLFLLPPIPPSIRVFSNESNLCMRWPKYLSFSFNISPSNVDISFSLFSFWDPYMWMLILPQDNLNSSHFLNLFFYFAFLTRQFPWFFLIT